MDEDQFLDELNFDDQPFIIEGDSCFLEESTRRRNDGDKTIVGMLELMNNSKDLAEINENTITKQKEKAEQMINELQLKMQQITLETPRTSELREEEKLPDDLEMSEEINESIRHVQHEVVAQYDLTLGSVNNGLASFFYSDKLCKLQLPESYLPQGINVGNVVTVSIARKKTEEKLAKNLILDIQEEILECEKKYLKGKKKLGDLLN